MVLMPKPSLLLLGKPRNTNVALTETKGTLISSMPGSGIQHDELVISSKKLEGMTTFNGGTESMHLTPKNLFHSMPIKYVCNLKTSQEGAKTILVHSLFDKFKRHSKDLAGEYRKEQSDLCMRGIPRGTNYSDLCRAGKLSAKFSRNYAVCIPQQSVRSQRSTKFTMGYYEEQANSCVRDVRGFPGLLCVGVEYATFCGTDGETSDPLLPENTTSPSERTKQSRGAAKIGNECALTTLPKLELPWQEHPSCSTIIPSSSDPPQIQSTEDLSVIINKSEQHSPVSVLKQFFEDPSPRLADAIPAIIKPVKPPIRPHHINFEEQSPVKRLKFHSDTISKTSAPSKQHTSSVLEFARKVLETSGLNWHQLALKWHCSIQMLDPVRYSKTEPQLPSQIVTLAPPETHLLFDHINEAILDTYQPYCGFYPWVPLSRPNKPHLVTERDFIDEIIKIVETNLIPRQHQNSGQLVMNSMEKCKTWMDTHRELEDMVLEIVDEAAEELVEEFVFEMWIDD